MDKNATGSRVETITLKSGEVILCGTVINASGPRAVLTSRMAGIEIPVEPRKRYTSICDAEQPLDRDLLLTIDPSGVHIHTDGTYYLRVARPKRIRGRLQRFCGGSYYLGTTGLARHHNVYSTV